ncbi:hypothetical protein LTR84_012865 [Exophiala bonariae]|uniref:Aquaporin n=1 Tax=Exophiala bonariae TaxID=1690606 RepID=A0AAV9ND24_9EURO|nr:hypothetical protein LTR84_012865 [Exophiala bonariae]
MSESQNLEETPDQSAYRQRPISPSHESPTHSSQQAGSVTPNARADTQRAPASSPDRFDARFPRFQQPALSPIPSTGIQEITRLVSRDSPNPRTSNSPNPRPSRNSATHLPPPQVRRRYGSIYLSPSPDPNRPWRGSNTSKKGSVPVAVASGLDSDAASRKWSLGGVAPLENPASAQNYVEPGYGILNPAYEQPSNVRPVWSLGKPLPHVLGPAALPSKKELQRQQQHHRDYDDDDDESGLYEDLEVGGRHHRLRSDSIRDRERRLIESYQQYREISPAISPFSGTRRSSTAEPEAPSRHHRVKETTIFEDDDEELSHQGRRSLQHSELDFPHLPRAIANVNQAKEEESLDRLLQDHVPLPGYLAEDLEVHNFHNSWGPIRKRFRGFLSELLGITLQYTLGLSVNLTVAVSGSNGYGVAEWGWGFATMAAVYVSSGASGGHLNPAITIMLFIYRGFPRGKVPSFIVAHILGAFIATMITFALFRRGLLELALIEPHEESWLYFEGRHRPNSRLGEMPPARVVLSHFITYPRANWVNFPVAFCTEFLAATILGVIILALLDDTNTSPGANLTAFIAALVVTVLGMAFGYNTGLALNPARDLGPRLALACLGYGTDSSLGQSLWSDRYWLKVAIPAPICGTILSGFIYDSFIFGGSESPVNWPARRWRRLFELCYTKILVTLLRLKRKSKDVKDDLAYLTTTEPQ